MIDRRSFLQAGLASAGLSLTGAAAAQTSIAARSKLRLLVPAGQGGGWDQTAKAVAATLQSTKLVEQIEFEHKPGKGGVPGLGHFVEKYAGDPNALMIGGLVMAGAIALHRAPIDLSKVQPVAKLTTDYVVIAVPKDSRFKTMKALVEAMKRAPQTLNFGGGSAGGVDHMLMGMIGRAIGADVGALKYTASAGGTDFVNALKKGELTAGLSGYSEFKDAFADGSLRPLAISSRYGLYGVPSLREQGIATDVGNWRGLFAPPGVAADVVQGWTQTIQKMAAAPEWKAVLDKNNWRASPVYGGELRSFVDYEQTTARVIIHLLKLQA